MKLCSFIIPTRTATFESLNKAVHSILDGVGACYDKDACEILLRVDDDDHERIPVARDLVNGCGKCVVGPRGIGYLNMGAFVSDLVAVADSAWCWLFDDDAYVDGNWYEPLKAIKCDAVNGPAANSEYYVLGASYYRNGARGGAPGIIIPTALAKTIPHGLPTDQQWLDVVMQKGWYIAQLPNVKYFHDGRPRTL